MGAGFFFWRRLFLAAEEARAPTRGVGFPPPPPRCTGMARRKEGRADRGLVAVDGVVGGVWWDGLLEEKGIPLVVMVCVVGEREETQNRGRRREEGRRLSFLWAESYCLWFLSLSLKYLSLLAPVFIYYYVPVGACYLCVLNSIMASQVPQRSLTSARIL
jgi:hypothetical protein